MHVPVEYYNKPLITGGPTDLNGHRKEGRESRHLD